MKLNHHLCPMPYQQFLVVHYLMLEVIFTQTYSLSYFYFDFLLDGLKPVHRRVLYAMYALNLSPSSSFRKCARVVGEVLGKFHPHGDQSVYDALVRMAQDFVMLHPLVNGHGNFGSVDDDPAAAMRYTEAKLSSLAYDALLADIDEETVNFLPNFDGSEQEPEVLPARLPILLMNG